MVCLTRSLRSLTYWNTAKENQLLKINKTTNFGVQIVDFSVILHTKNLKQWRIYLVKD